VEVARHVKQGMAQVTDHRVETKDAFFYNWTLKIPEAFQFRFVPTHEAMAQLQLHRGRPVHELAADLRRAFSGIVAGNVKEEGIRAIEAHGPYESDRRTRNHGCHGRIAEGLRRTAPHETAGQ
jgi:hypothetical protein